MYKIPAKTLFTGKNLVFVPQCHSTNTLAMELSQKKELNEGTVIITNSQTHGKGQQGNVWISEPEKNLTMSVVLKPAFLAITEQFFLNMIVSLGVKDYLELKLGVPIRVKWPNDIVVQEKKIGGILIENQIQGNAFTNSIVGIGLNVNQNAFHDSKAISMVMISNVSVDLMEVFENVCYHTEEWYIKLRQGSKSEIKRTYLNSLYGLNQRLGYSDKNGRFEGSVTGVDDAGRLMVSTDNGLRHYNTKEVQLNE